MFFADTDIDQMTARDEDSTTAPSVDSLLPFVIPWRRALDALSAVILGVGRASFAEAGLTCNSACSRAVLVQISTTTTPRYE